MKRIEPQQSGCWFYNGPKDRDGYGRYVEKNRKYQAHRYSYQYHNNRQLTANECVCHICDNPPCVNPAHLFVGDRAMNNQDKTQKGRQARGTRYQRSKLQDHDIKKIRNDTRCYPQIAKEYDIGVSTVSKIKNRITWRHI